MNTPYHWDSRKAARNLSKHDISFQEGVTVFDDPLFVVFADPDHSVREKRFIIIGESSRKRWLVVAYTERSNGIRVISARKATPQEREIYEEEI
ncbi:MAG: BrnT family toxin [Acidobacteria bacterium]|nr:BrnT family toxin [Acidobacteriota bacterium]